MYWADRGGLRQGLCRHFSVPKTDKGYRLIASLKRQNEALTEPPPLLCPTFSQVGQAVRGWGPWMGILDVEDAFLHVPLHPNTKARVGGIDGKGQIFQYNSLPFGLSWSPWAFSTTLHYAILGILPTLHHMKVHVVQYMDDLLVLGPTQHLCQKGMDLLAHHLKSLGWKLKESKVQPPATKQVYLGWEWNSTQATVMPSPKRLAAIRALAAQTLHRTKAPVKSLQRLQGMVTSVTTFLRKDNFWWRPIQHSLQQAGSANTMTVTWTQALRDALQWWRTWTPTPCPLEAVAPVVTLAVDASKQGWGAVQLAGEHQVPAAPLPPSPAQPKGEFPWAQGFWGEGEADLHINLQEALAALRGIQALIPKPNLLPPNSTIALQVDSTTTAAYLQKNLQGGRKQTVWGVLQPLHQWLSKHNLNLEAHWVASEDNIADGPSRVSADRTDWTLHPAIREVLLDKLGLDPKVDLFATWQNTQCPYFISRGPQPSTKHRTQVACNTWNTPPSALPYRVWWANPPWGELQHLPGWVDKMPKGALVVALFPRWEQQLWYHRLIRRHNNNYPLLLIPGQRDRGRGSSSSSSSKGGSTQRLLSPFTNPSIRGSHWPQWQTCCAVLHSSLSGPVVGDRRLPNFTRLNW